MRSECLVEGRWRPYGLFARQCGSVTSSKSEPGRRNMRPKTSGRQDGVKLVATAHEAARAAERLLADASAAVRQRVMAEQHLVERLFEREQRGTHGVAWLAAYVESIRQLAACAERMHASGRLSEMEELLIQLGIGEYLAQIAGGIPMSPGEMVRPSDVG